MDNKDYYQILQVDPSATTDQIKAAYRRLAFLYHPDVSSNAQDVSLMQRINEAYEILSDPSKRAAYDLERNGQPPFVVVQEPPSPPPQPPPVKEEPYQPPEPQPAHRPEERTRPRRRRQGIPRKRLRIIYRIAIVVTILFLWSLITGEVSIAAIIFLVLLSIQVIYTIIAEVRNL